MASLGPIPSRHADAGASDLGYAHRPEPAVARCSPWLVLALLLAAGTASCNDGPTVPGGRTYSVEIFTDPFVRDLPIEIKGPETRTVRVERGIDLSDDPRFQSTTRFSSEFRGYVGVDGLFPGRYRARVVPEDEDAFFIIRGSEEFEVVPRVTAIVTFILPPASATFSVGDTVAGPRPSPPGTTANGYRLRMNEEAPIDVRLTVGEYRKSNLYYSDYAGIIYAPDGSAYDGPMIEEEIWGETGPRLGKITIWPRTVVPGASTLTILVKGVIDIRGIRPEWYGLAARRSGTVARLHHRTGMITGPWDPTVQDTVWIWNAGAGSAAWSASTDDGRLSFEPGAGTLPVATHGPSGELPPPDAQPLVLRLEEDGTDPRGAVRVGLQADGDNWGDSGVQLPLRLHDPRISTLFTTAVDDGLESYEDGDGSFIDLATLPDGSAVVVSREGLLRVDLEGGVSSRVPSFLDERDLSYDAVGSFRLEAGPDGSLYVLLHSRDPDELWRIRPDGSEELVVDDDDFPGERAGIYDVAVTPEGSIFLAAWARDGTGSARVGIWSVTSTGAPRFLGGPGPGCCEAIAYDPSTERAYLSLDDPPGLVAFDLATERFTWAALPPGLESSDNIRVHSLAVGRSGRVYGSGDLVRENVFFEYDPTSDTWKEEVIGPPWLAGVDIAEGRVVAAASGHAPVVVRLPELPDNHIVALPVDDGPP